MLLEQNLALPRCPHCGIANPNLPTQWIIATTNHSGRGQRNWHVYICQNCGGLVLAASPEGKAGTVSEIYPDRSMETFEFEYLDGDVRDDFQEALKCFSYNCFNAFAAMCRRTIQSLAEQLGAKGKDKVTKQIVELKDLLSIDDETYQILEQIIITGHDGAHPYLPRITPERAAILLALMKDVLNQLCVRKKKLEEAAQLRKKAIDELKK